MDQTVVSIIIGVISLIVGSIAGKVLFAKNTKNSWKMQSIRPRPF